MDAPQIGQRPLPALLYADDCVLMFQTGVGLQWLLNSFNNFMNDLGLKTNVAKSHGMVGKYPTIAKTCFIGSEKLLYVSTFSYLGILFDTKSSWHHLMEARIRGFNQNLEVIFRFAKKLGSRPLKVIVEIYKARTCAATLFGAGVWGSCNTLILQAFRKLKTCF